MSHDIRVAFSLEAHLSLLPGAMAARDATAPPPQSPVAKARDLSPPPAPAPQRFARKNRGVGQVLLDAVEIRMLSGNVVAEVRGNASTLPDEFWYTAQLRNQIAAIMGIEARRLKLANVKSDEISDKECVDEGHVTAIGGQPEREPLVFEGLPASRA